MSDELSPRVQEAIRILTEDGVPYAKAERIAIIAEEEWIFGHMFRDPVEYANHFVALRQAMRDV